MLRALTNTSNNTLSLFEMPAPQVGPGEVLVEIAASYVAPFLNDLIPPDTTFVTPNRPFSPGLDAIGRIAELGSDTRGLSLGDMVFVDCLIDHGWDGHNGAAAFAGNFAVSAQADAVLGKWQHGTFATHIHMPRRECDACRLRRWTMRPLKACVGLAGSAQHLARFAMGVFKRACTWRLSVPLVRLARVPF